VEPELVVILVSLVACTVGVATLARLLGLTGLQATLWAALATGGLAALVVGGFYALLAECLYESDYGFAWHWSPRRELCDEENSPAQLGYYALAVAPPLVASLGAFLWSRRRRTAGFVASLSLLGVVFLPFAYIEALPVYSLERTPVLHDPYLRVPTDSGSPRACYVFGIAHGPDRIQPTDETERVCVDLARTPAALALTAGYDGGETSYALTWLGRTLTENGMDEGTEWEGLVVERVYRLPGTEARAGASLIRT
jgi:hypothetical protein